MSTKMCSTKNWRSWTVCRLTLLFAVTCITYAVTLSDGEASEIIGTTDYSLVLFGGEECVKCTEILRVLDELSTEITSQGVKIKNVVDSQLSKEYGVRQIPELFYFRHGFPVQVPVEELKADNIGSWLEQHKQVGAKPLNDDNFEHLTQATTGATTGDWFVMFYQPSCKELLSTWETVAQRMNYKINVAMVDVSANTMLAKRFSITECPQLMYFRFGKMYRFGHKSREVSALVMFADGGFRHETARPIPKLATPFDDFTDRIATYLKHVINKTELEVVPTILVVMLIIAVMFGYLCARNKRHPKDD